MGVLIMTYYNVAFEEKQYRAVANRAAKYFQDRCDSSIIPLIVSDVPDAYEYRYVNLLDPHASSAGLEWSAHGQKGTVVHNYSDYELYTQQLNLMFDLNERNKFGDALIADKRGALIDKWAIDVDLSAFHGPMASMGLGIDNPTLIAAGTVKRPGSQLAEGLIGQLTSIENLDGTDSVLDVKGDIWYGINTMIDAIPFAIRKEGPPMIMITDEYVPKEASSPDRIYMDSVEIDFIKKYLMGEGATEGRKIGKWLVSNKILAEVSDDTDGVAPDSTDTVGTDSRIMLFVPDPRWCGRIVSRGFSLVGEDSGALGTEQIYGWKGRAVWFNTDCAEYSENIYWA